MVLDLEISRKFYGSAIPKVFEIPEEALARITDTDQRTGFEQKFFLWAERICGAVRAEDCASAAAYLQDQLRCIAENCIGMPYPATRNLTVNRFLSLLQYRLADEKLADWRYLAQLDFSRELVAADTMEDYLAVGKRMAEQLIFHIKDQRTQHYHGKMHDIFDYVETNATDVNMGLTAVAREFRMKPRDAAESFRQYFGESINDVIHKTRVKKAKELLLTTEKPVQEIAQAVGYCSLATMYRAFTNVEGVAPGRLRQKKADKTDAR
jgi:AraC-like DNA-binding protein